MPAFRGLGTVTRLSKGATSRPRKMTKEEKRLAERRRVEAHFKKSRQLRKPREPDTRSGFKRLEDALDPNRKKKP